MKTETAGARSCTWQSLLRPSLAIAVSSLVNTETIGGRGE